MDCTVKISVCNRRTDRKYKNQEQQWGRIRERCRTPVRTTETAEEYRKLAKKRRDDLKDTGGFVGGWLRGGVRKNGALVNKNWTLKLYFFTYNLWLLYSRICFSVLLGCQISE